MARLRGKQLAAFLLFSTLWSGNWLAIRVGLRDLPPLLFAGLRMVIACALLVPLARRSGQAVTARERGWIALVGLLQIGISYACVFTAEQWIESGFAALLFSTFPIWVGILGHVFLSGERLTVLTIAAAALGISGVAILEWPALVRAAASRPPGLLAGGALMVVSALVSAVAVIVMKKHLPHVPAMRNVRGQAVVAAAFLLLASLALERGAPVRWTPSAALALLYLGVLGTLTFVGIQWLVPRVSVAVVGAFPLVNTVLALFWGAALAGETVSVRLLVGAVLILFGVAVATSAPTPAPALESA
jgi:drug/metabolite transporter (DMT)-like permease